MARPLLEFAATASFTTSGWNMRNTHSHLSALASSILAIFVASSAPVSAQTPDSEFEHIGIESKSTARTQLCFGGAVVGLVTLLLLRRKKALSDE
jgi:hypothetical protein